MTRRGDHKNGRRSALPLTCSIHGPGLDVDVRVEDTNHLAELARTFMSGIRQGAAFAGGTDIFNSPHPSPAPSPAPPSPDDHDPAILRQAVTEDLRQMWNAMWADAPVHAGAQARDRTPRDHAARDARFDTWVAGPSGQAIIDAALSGGLGDHENPGDPN